ncbi:MAG: Uma2 family endonuclease [Actinomycetes bacterium]
MASSPIEASVEASFWSHEGPWTEADYLSLPDEWRRVELLDGALLVNPSPTTRHQRLSSRLWLVLESRRPAGMEILEAVNVRVAPERILIPDLVAVRASEEDQKVLDAADVALAVEIVSPGSVAADRAIKPQLYAAAGIPTYVRIELSTRVPVAATFHLEGGRYVPAPEAAVGSVLRLTRPFAAEVDLAALLHVERAQVEE